MTATSKKKLSPVRQRSALQDVRQDDVADWAVTTLGR